LKGFKVGFHAVPSMKQLHMHVISLDFDSPKLKTRKHWQSFNTAFFWPLELVINTLESKGKIQIDKAQYEKILKEEFMKCNNCSQAFKDLKFLKCHMEQRKCK
jgi:aprataxin